MRFLKERIFSLKSGVRHLVSLEFGALVLVWTYIAMALAQEEWNWIEQIYFSIGSDWQRLFFWGFIGVWIGLAALIGRLIYMSTEKWMVQYIVRFLYSVLIAIPIVNLIVPLLYRRHVRKKGIDVTKREPGLKGDLRVITNNMLYYNNNVINHRGRLRFGLIPYIMVTTFNLLKGILYLLGAIAIPVLSPVVMLIGLILVALLADVSPEAAYWTGVAAAGLTALICVIHPLIAFRLHKGDRMAAKVTEAARSTSTGEDVPAEVPAEVPEDAPDEVPEDAPEDAAVEMPQEPEAPPQDAPDAELPVRNGVEDEPTAFTESQEIKALVPDSGDWMPVAEPEEYGLIHNYKEKD